MADHCPISNTLVNAKAARLTSFLTFGLLVCLTLQPNLFALLILVYDFSVRGFTKKKWSLLGFVSNFLLSALKVEAKKVNAGPKIFAAKIGFVFSCILFVLFLLNLLVAMKAVTILFLVSVGLEAFFGYCIACKLYGLLNR